ncbi:ATP-binding cassette domain-containing protein [Paucibacter sp. APW11]|uniref:ATP-binding cassette domain-containing protein n=1 Tax=Roseateles aquae TaxID=3077235 RepID=A0ABU3P8A4_9BURK|nr:ATP-binding cassette domain-containing protein [Paucibacter sp. APW11]MDT8998809.1 ATP-binding cassette domain-containing protein [Paucibacter sp. APW11]
MRAEGLSLAAGSRIIQRDLSFELARGEILVLMGGSGCGKSTLMRHLIGLQPPAAGRVLYGDVDLSEADDAQLAQIQRQFGVMFQAGALWSSMTVGENVMLPLREFTELDDAEAEQLARFKLALVGLDGAFDELPAALSGGMKKRAAIARAMALDPPLLFLDEPSAGLDPLSSTRLDELILNLRDHLGTSIVLVTHELDSIFAVADRALFLDAKEKTMTALDAPRALLQSGPDTVRAFLRREARP